MLTRKTVLSFLGVVGFLGMLVLPEGCRQRPNSISIAIMTKLASGSIVGSSEINAAKLFLEDNKIDYIHIVPIDDNWEPEKAKEACKTIPAQQIPILITSHISACAVAIKDQVIADKILTLVTGATTDALSGQDDLILRNIPDVEIEQKAIAEYVKKLEGEKVVVFPDSANMAYTEPGLKYFKKYITGKTIQPINISSDAIDPAAVESALRQSPFDIAYILIGGYRSSAVGVMSQVVARVNPSAPIILTPWVKSPVLLEAAGSAIKNCVLPSHYPPRGQNPAVDTYIDRFRKRYGYAPTFISLNVYTGLEILDEALQKGYRTPSDIKAYILEQRTFQTLFGPITFNSSGDVELPIYFSTDIAREF